MHSMHCKDDITDRPTERDKWVQEHLKRPVSAVNIKEKHSTFNVCLQLKMCAKYS